MDTLDSPQVHLSGIAYAVGEPRSVRALDELAHEPQVRATLEASGVRVFCAAPSLASLVERSVRSTLERAALTPEDIGNIVFTSGSAVWSSGDDAELLVALQDIGFTAVIPRGVFGQQCANFGLALDVAVLVTQHSRKSTLLVVVDRVQQGLPRLLEPDVSVSGDGAASCILSSAHGGFGFLSHAVYSNRQMVEQARQRLAGSQVLSHARAVRHVLDQLCKRAQLDRDALACVLPPNLNETTQVLVSSIVELSIPEVASRNLAAFGHVQVCDALINLAAAVDAGALSTNDRVALLSVGLFGWSGVLLQVH